MMKAVPFNRYTITVCNDGHVSIIDKEDKRCRPSKQRRLGAALPVFAVDDILIAFELIRRVCVLTRAHHGGTTGTLIEPKIIGWPIRREATLHDLEEAKKVFEQAHESILKGQRENEQSTAEQQSDNGGNPAGDDQPGHRGEGASEGRA